MTKDQLSPEMQYVLDSVNGQVELLIGRVGSLEDLICKSTRSESSILDEIRKHGAQIQEIKDIVEESEEKSKERMETHEKVYHSKQEKPGIVKELAVHGAKSAIQWVVLGLISALTLGLLAMAKPHLIQAAVP